MIEGTTTTTVAQHRSEHAGLALSALGVCGELGFLSMWARTLDEDPTAAMAALALGAAVCGAIGFAVGLARLNRAPSRRAYWAALLGASALGLPWLFVLLVSGHELLPR